MGIFDSTDMCIGECRLLHLLFALCSLLFASSLVVAITVRKGGRERKREGGREEGEVRGKVDDVDVESSSDSDSDGGDGMTERRV